MDSINRKWRNSWPAWERINLLADKSNGFIWRLQTESGNAVDVQPFEDEKILFNMSVWESMEQLKQYVYRSQHLDFMKKKGKWFHLPGEQHLVLWWIKVDHLPTIEEAKSRLKFIQQKGPGPEGFNFANPYSPPTR